MTKGERIKQLRTRKRISQSDLAKLLKTTKQTISKYEKGIVTNIPSDRIEELARILDTTPEYILGWEITPETKKDNERLAKLIVRMRTDKTFFSLIDTLYDFDEAQITSVSEMVKALQTFKQ